MASLTASRFAVLHVEDDDSDQELQTQTKKDEGKQTKSAGAKKRARKKKKNQQINAENAQLRDLAFSKIPSKTQACTIAPNPARSTKTESGKTVGENGRQWKQWSEKDKEFVSDQFEKDLEKAILQSKIDFEKQASCCHNDMSGDGDNQPKQNHKERRKHSQKDKSQTLTLQQLHGGMGLEDIPQSTKPRKSPVVEDEKFFEKVEKDVEKLVLKEERDRFRKVNDRFAAESIRKVQFEDILSKKDEEISKLSEIVTKLKDELQTVKKRNKQLCLILAQGEMKEKAVILKQVDELNNDKDEYIQQVSELTASLEQERSKVSNLKTELQKYQYSSHHHHQDKKK